MPGEWILGTLDDLVDFNPRRQIKKGTIAPFVAMTDITEHQKYIANIDSREYTGGGSRFSNGDTLFARITPCLENGKTALVSGLHEETAVAHGSTEFIIMAPKYPESDFEFIYYLARLPEFRKYAEARMEGTSGRQRVSWQSIAEYELEYPAPVERRNIGRYLAELDRKIELNRQMNSTLEEIAQALFKSWFVDFDPVIDNALAAGNPIPEALKAKAATRQALGEKRKPLPETIRQQFPNSFEFSEEVGWVPVGWEVNALGDYLNVFETGRRPKGGVAKYTSGVPSVGAESINGIGKFDFGKTKFVPEDFFENMKSGKIDSYDVLLYKDGGKPGEFKPRIGMFGDGFPFDSFGINEHVFRMRSEKLGQPFLYFQTGSVRVFHHFAVRGGKAAIPGINQTEVKSVDFLIPSAEILNRFNDFSYLLISKILDKAVESQTLTKLRDTLLPKLLSGELRIPDADKLMANSL